MPVDLKDYVDVKQRIKLFYDKHPDGRLVTTEVRVTSEPDGTPRVWVEAAAYRSPEDPLPGKGWSWMGLPGQTNFTRNSEIENTETSAWGRAIGALGIGIDGGIASKDEIDAKAGSTDAPPPNGIEAEEIIGRLSKTGIVRKGSAQGYKLDSREAPDGTHTIGFRLELADDRDIPQVLAEGPVGEAIYLATAGKAAELVGQRVTVKGRLFNVKAPGRSSYYRLRVLEIEAPEFKYPAEAPTETLFSEDEQAKLDAAVDKAPAGTAA